MRSHIKYRWVNISYTALILIILTVWVAMNIKNPDSHCDPCDSYPTDELKKKCQEKCAIRTEMDEWFGNVVYYLYMELAIVLMRLISIGFFLAALVFIWRYMVKNEVSFSDDEEGNKTRSCAMLVTHTFALLAFVGA